MGVLVQNELLWRVLDLPGQIDGFLAHLHFELALNDLVKLLEQFLFGKLTVLGVAALDNLVHPIEVLVHPDLVLDHGAIALDLHLLVFPGHMHVFLLVKLQESARCLLEADHVLLDVLATVTVVIFA